MAKKSDSEEKQIKEIDINDILSSVLKNTKSDHFNFEPEQNYKVRSSSLFLTSILGGGLGPGCHRMIGLASGGKSSCTLDFMYHFLKDQTVPRRGVYIPSEGRLSQEIKDRSGVEFVYDSSEWKDGNCFVFESNIFEAVFKLKRDLITNNPRGIQFFFVTDSTDALIKRDDFIKSEEESITVGGGSLITSVFMKKVSMAMSKRGHVDVYISQIRDSIQANKYNPNKPKQGNASGPRALEHQADNVLEFLHRIKEDKIFDGDKIIGHFCKIKIIKSKNEKNDTEIRYPIKYGQVGGKSVWSSYELAEVMIAWEALKKSGAWLTFNPEFYQELSKQFGEKVPEQINGINKTREWIDNNPDIQEFIYNKFKDLIM